MRISDWSSDVCSSDLPCWPWRVCSSDPGYSGERPGQATSGGRYYSSRFPPHLKHNRISGPPLGIACPIAPRRRIGALVLDEVQFGNRVFSDVIPFPSAGIDAPDFQYSRNTDSEAANRCRSEEHTSELQSLMRISYAVFCLKKTKP